MGNHRQLPPTPRTLTKSYVPRVHKESIEERKLANKLKLLNNELKKQVDSYKKTNNQLGQAIKILRKFEQETKILLLIDKWRSISQGGMSYMLNSTLLKIDRMGGYEELRRKELEAEKRKIEYQVDDRLQDEMDNVLESEEFKALPDEDQEEYKARMQNRIDEMTIWKEKELSKLDENLKSNSENEMTMRELSQRLKVDYDLVFPE
ncbi:MEI5 (YPL121C) [Zygosaccharomyces parabailii]|nr:MEI5 (YPL121C) [Zygosaccharomyces parabailii]CDH10618.1 related to Meiosis protein 5 [Zygosaccharomyces bailii ISA1307]